MGSATWTRSPGVRIIPCPLAPLLCALVVGASPAQEPEGKAPEPATVYGLSGGWGGLRDSLGEQGISLDFSITFEANRVLSGGLKQQLTSHTLYDLNGSFDLDRIAGWKDAQLSFEAYVNAGHNPSQDVGDYQYFSDFSSDHLAQIAQVFYEQWFAERTLRLKLGKMDANSDFGSPANQGESIHSSSWLSPTIFTMVTYPNPATGILAGWAPNEDWSLKVGMYDGAAMAGVDTGSVGPASFFGDPPGTFTIGELGRRWSLGTRELAGGATLGAWNHSGTFDDVFGGTTHGTTGYYGTLDQEFRRAPEGQSGGTQAGFLQFGFADADVSPVDTHLGLGLHWTGACCARPDDVWCIYVSQVHFSAGAGFSASSETACECSYVYQVCPGISLQPDLQWIANPGGDASIDDALVFSLRCELGF